MSIWYLVAPVASTSIRVSAEVVFSSTSAEGKESNTGAAAEAGSPPESTVASATDTDKTMRRTGFGDFMSLPNCCVFATLALRIHNLQLLSQIPTLGTYLGLRATGQVPVFMYRVKN